MSAAGLSSIAAVLSPAGFAVLTWGSILLVAVAFGYVVRTLLVERR